MRQRHDAVFSGQITTECPKPPDPRRAARSALALSASPEMNSCQLQQSRLRPPTLRPPRRQRRRPRRLRRQAQRLPRRRLTRWPRPQPRVGLRRRLRRPLRRRQRPARRTAITRSGTLTLANQGQRRRLQASYKLGGGAKLFRRPSCADVSQVRRLIFTDRPNSNGRSAWHAPSAETQSRRSTATFSCDAGSTSNKWRAPPLGAVSSWQAFARRP